VLNWLCLGVGVVRCGVYVCGAASKVMCPAGSHVLPPEDLRRILKLDPSLQAAHNERLTFEALRAMPDFIPCSAYGSFLCWVHVRACDRSLRVVWSQAQVQRRWFCGARSVLD
jgi:hypothetical protein